MHSKRAAAAATAALSVALLAPFAAPTGAAHAATASPHQLIADAARAALRGVRQGARGSVPATPFSVPGPTCETYPYTDPAHDTSSSIDIVAYKLTQDCLNGQWTVTLAAAHGFASSSVQFVEIDVDNDGNPNDNCEGFDYSEVGEYDPHTTQFDTATIQWLGSCNKHTDLIYTPAISRPSGSTLSITFTQRPAVWGGAITSFANATGSQFDYTPNSGVNRMLTTGSAAFATSSLPRIRGTYTQVVAGDFNGDGRSDLLLYAAGSAPDSVMFSESSGLTSWFTKPVTINGAYKIIPGDFNGDGNTDLLFYGPGSAPDFVWLGSYTGTFKSVPITINGNYTSIVAGDFNGDGKDDLFFYAAGPGTDYIGFSNGDGTFTTKPSPIQIYQPYQIAAGDINGDGRADLVLYVPHEGHILLGQSNGTFVDEPLAVNNRYAWLRLGDFNGDGRDDMLLVNPDTPPDALAYGTTNAPYLTTGPATTVAENYQDAVVGDFTGDGTDDVLFYGGPNIPTRTWIGHSFPLQITAPVLPGALPGQQYSYAVANTAPAPRQQWSATGLPSGFSIDPSTGTISGESSTLSTTATVTISVRDSRGRHDSRNFRFNVMPGLTQVSASYASTCALASGGVPYCWGEAVSGDGTVIENALVPTEITGLSGLQAIADGGSGVVCAITAAGAEKCWGDNSIGELGDGKAENHSYTPVQVTGLTSGVQAISIGAPTDQSPRGASCAITAGGADVCWGLNTHGEVGDGTNTERDAPAPVNGLTSGVTSIATGVDHSCAVKAGNVWCWGSGSTLGNGTTTASSVPVEVTGLSGVVSVVAGASHTCALTSAGAVWCWGHNSSGQLGDGQTGAPVATPTEVIGLNQGVTSLSLGDIDSCATKSDGTVWCWGMFDGPDQDNPSSVPVLVTELAPGTTMVSAAAGHACAGSQTALQCWGNEWEAGDGSSNSLVVPPVEVHFDWGP